MIAHVTGLKPGDFIHTLGKMVSLLDLSIELSIIRSKMENDQFN